VPSKESPIFRTFSNIGRSPSGLKITPALSEPARDSLRGKIDLWNCQGEAELRVRKQNEATTGTRLYSEKRPTECVDDGCIVFCHGEFFVPLGGQAQTTVTERTGQRYTVNRAFRELYQIGIGTDVDKTAF
jgi:hypothetical protein